MSRPYGLGDVGPDPVPLRPISVRTAQQGLTVLAQEDRVQPADPNEPLPSPGAVDGVWGDATHRSLLTLVRQDAALSETALRAYSLILFNTPPRSDLVQVPLRILTELNEAAARYRAPTRSTSAGPVPMPTVLPPSAIMPASSLPSWVWPSVVGLGVALVVVGGGYWLMRRRR